MPAAGSVVDPTASELTIGCADPIAYTLLPRVLERFCAAAISQSDRRCTFPTDESL